jgi:diacylglycerol kinase (ATP)
VAFSIATAVSLNTGDPLISLLCIAMAVMVSHSRLLMRIHTMREVVLGSLVGAGLTIVVLLAFRYLG